MQMGHAGNVLLVSSIAGMPIRNRNGDCVGAVKDMIVDLERGRIVVAFLTFNGLLGLGDKLFAVPWPALQYDALAGSLVGDIERVRLDEAPGFAKGDWPRTIDREFIDGVHRHYGYAPYFDG